MGRINVVRVVIGGLVAGVAANALDYVISTYVLAREMAETVQRLNLRADLVEQSMWTWIGFDVVYGLLVVFTYAAIRPRFGPGWKTALMAGMCYWVAFTAMSAGYTSMGMFTHPTFVRSAAFSLFSTLVPAVIGASLYQEEEEARPAD
jgi:hypothetical protein